ncbi:DUF3307 domain-containing protein [Alteromonas gilva]|uniref:DUF3307 domain-containing protein n=1 Tax=Alteromonas gilva TaxID=2987522 RepID=A0ABT5L1N6_9ALTE|nr:DUF3307 domain-containing protein [Alteromonas gilva]MDC8830792.1 DUF3307 domain-containing protein [Alteromonas gilva]
MSIVNLLTLLLAVHIIADFYLQPGRWISQRNNLHFSAPCLYWHGAIHGLLALLVLFVAAPSAPIMIVAYAVFMGASHIVIDGIKSFAKPALWAFTADQLAHVAVILFVTYLASNMTYAQLTGYISKAFTYQSLIIMSGFLVILRPVSVVVKLLLKPWSDAVYKERDLADAPTDSASDSPDLASAGQRIGYLERTLILIFILLNQFAAIGFLLAAKSVFRFGDLRQSEDKKLTEYVMLGTLTSFAITIVIGLLISSIATQLPVGK